MVLPRPGQRLAPPLAGDQEGTDLGERLGNERQVLGTSLTSHPEIVVCVCEYMCEFRYI